jgi:hypothetical protein
MKKRWVRGPVCISCAAWLIACSSDSAKGGPAASTAPGRGSAACEKWQNAVCAWVSKCGAPAGACDQAKGIICKSDDQASSCATGFAAATCMAVPSGCDSVGLADTAAAQGLCRSYLSAACDALIRCNLETDKAACTAKLTGTQDCSRVVGVGLGYEKCLDDLGSAACTALIPPSCDGVFFATQ